MENESIRIRKLSKSKIVKYQDFFNDINRSIIKNNGMVPSSMLLAKHRAHQRYFTSALELNYLERIRYMYYKSNIEFFQPYHIRKILDHKLKKAREYQNKWNLKNNKIKKHHKKTSSEQKDNESILTNKPQNTMENKPETKEMERISRYQNFFNAINDNIFINNGRVHVTELASDFSTDRKYIIAAINLNYLERLGDMKFKSNIERFEIHHIKKILSIPQDENVNNESIKSLKDLISDLKLNHNELKTTIAYTEQILKDSENAKNTPSEPQVSKPQKKAVKSQYGIIRTVFFAMGRYYNSIIKYIW